MLTDLGVEPVLVDGEDGTEKLVETVFTILDAKRRKPASDLSRQVRRSGVTGFSARSDACGFPCPP